MNTLVAYSCQTGNTRQLGQAAVALAYGVQVQAAAWYVRFTDRIFGLPRPAPAAPGPLAPAPALAACPVAPPSAES